jgi:hypothetical protein
MNVPVSLLRIAATAAFAIALVACGKQPAPAPAPTPAPAPAPAPAPIATPAPPPVAPAGVQVASIALGTAASPNLLGAAFAPSDAINAVVSTTGTAASATLAAKWTFQDGQVVDETSQTIVPTGPASTTFTIQKPDGWPVGRYKVEIMLDGQPAGSSEFEVK